MIYIRRTEVQPFTEAQIALLQTFADQAVIAIENVRLFTELQEKNLALTQAHGQVTEALEQQTATAEILRVISRSPTDVQPVLEMIAQRSDEVCDGFFCVVFMVQGDHLHLRASHNIPTSISSVFASVYPAPLTSPLRSAQAVREGRAIAVADMQDEAGAPPGLAERSRAYGLRSWVSVPMMRAGRGIGAIAVGRREMRPFSEKDIALLQTFADQAVIAVENVRLFKELFGDLNEKQEEYLKDIHASGQHLLSLINDILDLSKIEAGRMDLERTDFNLPTAFDNALTLVRERAGRHGIALDMMVDERLGQIRADERKIRQVLLNLLSNAIKFTPDGGRIDVRAVLGDGGVEVSVSDTGVGMAPEDQEAIFEEFRQVGTAAKKVEGTGLGLALSRKFIELHGGRIWVQSQVGVGSTFTFTIPVRATRMSQMEEL